MHQFTDPARRGGRHPHGKIFDVDAVVAERSRLRGPLDVGNAYMLDELAETLAEDFRAARTIPSIRSG